jgi:hypothetical protein
MIDSANITLAIFILQALLNASTNASYTSASILAAVRLSSSAALDMWFLATSRFFLAT